MSVKLTHVSVYFADLIDALDTAGKQLKAPSHDKILLQIGDCGELMISSAAGITTYATLEAGIERDPEACPGCKCKPGDGTTPSCDHPDGCGFWKTLMKEMSEWKS